MRTVYADLCYGKRFSVAVSPRGDIDILIDDKPIITLDLYYLEEQEKPFVQVLLYDNHERATEEPVAEAIYRENGLLIIPGDGGCGCQISTILHEEEA